MFLFVTFSFCFISVKAITDEECQENYEKTNRCGSLRSCNYDEETDKCYANPYYNYLEDAEDCAENAKKSSECDKCDGHHWDSSNKKCVADGYSADSTFEKSASARSEEDCPEKYYWDSSAHKCVIGTAHVSCGNITGVPKKIPELSSFFITLAQVLTSIVLVIIGTIDLFKGITSGKEDEMKKGQQTFIKRLILGILIFFITAIVKLLIGAINNATNSGNIISCIDCFISNNCEAYSSNSSKNGTVSYSEESTEEYGVSHTSTTKGKTDTTKTNDSKTSNTQTTKKGNIKNNTLLVGDSRTVGMCSKNEGYGLCEDNEYIAKGSMGYTWFADTAIPQINNKIKSKEYNIVILMGVNMEQLDGKSEANKYYDKVSALAKGDWKNQNIIYVSINPVYDSKTYYVKMKHVNDFNNTMKSKINSLKLSNLTYCDTASNLNLKSSNYDSEGLHYDKETYSKIYKYIKSNCLK